MKLLIPAIVCCMLFCGCPRAKDPGYAEQLRAIDAAAVTAAGLDTAQLDATGKLLLRELLAGVEIHDADYNSTFGTYEMSEEDCRIAQQYIARMLAERGYAAPTEEEFRRRLHLFFGIDLKREQEHLSLGDEGWIPLTGEERYTSGIEDYYGPTMWHLHIDATNRHVSTELSLPLLCDYRNRYPQIAAVEQYIDRGKRLEILLDKLEDEKKIDKGSRAEYELTLFCDQIPRWKLTNDPIVAINKFLFHDDAASFRYLMEQYDYASFTDQLKECGYDYAEPRIDSPGDLGDLLDIRPDTLIVKRPGWVVLAAAQGDLDGDGQEDRALVIGLNPEMLRREYGQGEASRSDEEGPSEELRNRILIVAQGNAGKPEWTIRTVHRNLIPRYPAWGSNRDDPFDGLDLSEGRLTLRERSWMSTGSWWTGVYEYTFEYVGSQFCLTACESTELHRASGESTAISIDLKNGVRTGKKYNEFDTGVPAKYDTLHFMPRPQLLLEEMERGREYRLSEETSGSEQITITPME